jgi:serine/threonine protein phosphatase PrpC
MHNLESLDAYLTAALTTVPLLCAISSPQADIVALPVCLHTRAYNTCSSHTCTAHNRERRTPRHMRTSDLRTVFISQQQLRSFNLPYQLGRTNVVGAGQGSFETPRDAVNTSFPVAAGDIVIIATDGLYDNMELDEMCEIAQAWEVQYSTPCDCFVIHYVYS